RREADRARAVLWSLDGETSATIAARLGVRAEQVRRWRSAVRSGGVAALRARPRPGRAPSKREAALVVARDLLAAPVADRPVWTLARLAAERGADLRVEAPGRAKRRALLGALDHATHELIVVTSSTERSGDFVDLLGRLDHAYGPAPRREDRPVVLVLDDGPIHTGKAATAALAARPWLRVEWLPKYAPELNDIERSWRDLKRHYLAHRTFRDADRLDHAIHQAGLWSMLGD